MKIEIRPPFELDKEAWEKVKQGLFYSLLVLAGLWVGAVLMSHLLHWLVYLPEPYEGGL